MRLEFTDIQNFRKLKSCRIDLSKEQTILVGPNNSGKTTAMDVLSFFLKEKKKLTTRDFTLNNWIGLNSLAQVWLQDGEQSEEYWENQLKAMRPLLPQIDLWLNVSENEIQHVHHLIPTLDWEGGRIGVRLLYEPQNLELLFKEFQSTYIISKALSGKKKGNLKIWPKDFWSFLDREPNLSKFFSISIYLLDPAKVVDIKGDDAKPQELPLNSLPIEKSALDKLIKVNTINAQRGFFDANESTSKLKSLSSQLQEYFRNHLNPDDKPTEDDLDALESIDSATKSFDERLKVSFDPALTELEDINYPGFGNPSIKIASSLSPIDGMGHESSVHFHLNRSSANEEVKNLSLPEHSNGLGYQNLISIVFELIRFRDEWMKKGKRANQEEGEFYEPLHLVLIEEPEAHLHAQVQQVFIKKAYEILRNHPNLKKNDQFSTQLIVSTHSNHIAHEVDFNSLRYFKRCKPKGDAVATSKIINLSDTFGKDDLTTNFVTRYLRTTHCDLFFADVVILVEGSSERMLVPYFISSTHPNLSNAYLSIIEIQGSHAHKFRPLIEALNVITLIITDLDPIDPANNRKSVFPEIEKGYETGNSTISKWIPNEKKLDTLTELPPDAKIDKKVRVAYQIPQEISNNDKTAALILTPTSFEDSLVYCNMEFFKSMIGTGLIKKFKKAIENPDLKEVSKLTYDALRNCRPKEKATFALDLLFQKDPKELATPQYIIEGLDWIERELKEVII